MEQAIVESLLLALFGFIGGYSMYKEVTMEFKR